MAQSFGVRRAFFAACLICGMSPAWGQGTQPLVAVHDSEYTRALASMTVVSPTPTNTGFQWWTTNWNYFVMPESVKESLRSDGTAFTVVGDSNIVAGALLTNGLPRYPIVISLASEAIRNDEIAQFTNYVAAGGFLFVGSSSFTRNTNGTTRGNFAFANELGINMVQPALTNWALNATLTRLGNHRLVTHIPVGTLSWQMPGSADETPYGVSPAHTYQFPHLVWSVAPQDGATVIAQGDSSPYLIVKPYGKGYFIYCAAMQPLMGYGGWSPATYAYMIFRQAIEWAFESSRLPVTKLSPWPYLYDAAFMVRHDLENYQWAITNIESSAQFEATNGARGDYYFCTGTLRVELTNSTPAIIGLRRAVTNYGATISSHNGGLPNPVNTNLMVDEYDYWHWGTDEALDVTPPGYASGKAYALTSLSNSFLNIENWLTGITNGVRSWVACYFNGTREDTFDIEQQLNIKVAGEQKISPFPHWTLSTRTANKRYPMVSQPLSDWFVSGDLFVGQQIGQSLEYFTNSSLHDMVDYRYGKGLLINLYSHTLSHGVGPAGSLASEYVTYCVNTNLHPRMWGANAVGLYQWWLARSNAQITVSQTATSSNRSLTTILIAGSTDTNTTVEWLLPQVGALAGLQVFTNGVLASGGSYRTNGTTIKLRVGTTVTNALLSYPLGPVARDDFFPLAAGTTLTMPAAGVLANDAAGVSGTNGTAALVGGPANGTLTLTNNGGFTYVPTNGFAGTDAFTYRLNDGISNSLPGTVTLRVAPYGSLFFDDFASRSVGGADELLPWRVASGQWSVLPQAGGVLRGGFNPLESYAFAYVSNNWANYAVSGTVQLPAGAYGGGLGGRLNATNGGHYAAWVYPENSLGGSNVLKLIKFQSWTNFAYNGVPNTPMAVMNLPAVGTNAHTVKLAFSGNRIAVYFDGVQRTNLTDAEAIPFMSGGITADTWTDTSLYYFSLDDVSVYPVVTPDNYATSKNMPLSVPAGGVLSNDTPVYGASLTATVVSGPTNGTLYLTNNGGFTYVPTVNFSGVDAFTYSADDSGTNLGTVAATVTVYGGNSAPVLPAQTNRTILELTTLTVTNTATDADGPASELTYTLLVAPTNAVISTNGIITWTPNEAQGPSTNTFTTRVVDSGTPNFSATNTFLVFVTEQNLAPVLPGQTNRTIAELTTLTVTNTATDGDLPPNQLSYTLLVGPTNAVISTNGVITWTPTEAQGPGTNVFTTVVTDGGVPSLSATNSFTVVVTEVNLAPVLIGQINRTISLGDSLIVTNAATDADLPANALSYALVNPPAGATISTNGIINWTPTEAQAQSTNVITTIATDNGAPNLSATNTFIVTVINTNGAYYVGVFFENFDSVTAPGLPAGWTAASSGAQTNWFTQIPGADGSSNAVFSADPPTPSTNSLVSPAIVLPVGELQLSFRHNYNLESNYDGGILELKIGTNNFTGWLAAGGTFVSGGYTNTIDAGTDSILAGQPAWSGNSGGFITTVANLPAGASGQTIQLRWRLITDTGNGTTAVSWRVDTIGVSNRLCCNLTAPALPAPTNRTVAELTTLVVTNTATDADLPGDVLTYELMVAPTNAVIATNGVITWTPTEAQGPGTNVLTTRVTDQAGLRATNSFTVVVTEVNAAPVLPEQTNRTIAELTTLTVTNAATDADLPMNTLSYALLVFPAGATVNTNTGVIAWTPNEAQGPGTNVFTTVATDDGVPPLSATNSFTVVVTEVNTAPVLPAQSDRTVVAMTSLVVTNAAQDADWPANGLTYFLDGPTNAVIDGNGVISWVPSLVQSPSTNLFATVVMDDGVPGLSATNSFTVVVVTPDAPPVILSLVSANDVATVTWTAISGRTYRLQYKDGGGATNWNDVVPDVMASGDTAFTTNAISGSAMRYFRVLLVSPP